MSHSLTLLAHCQGLVSQIGQTLLTAQQIAWLGGTEQWETLFVGKHICKTTFLEGISLTMKSSTNHHDSTTTVFAICAFDVSLLGKVTAIEIFVTEILYALSKLKKLSTLNLSKNRFASKRF